MPKFRTSSLSVDLIYQLGTILRDHRKIEILKTDCWTFSFDGVSASYEDRNPVTYYGKGHFIAKIPPEYQKQGKIEDKVEVAAMCDLFPEGDYDQWIFYLWLKYPNGVIQWSSAQRRPGGQLDHAWARTSEQPRFRIGTFALPDEIRFR